jgi:hypothetical protein
MLIFLPKSISFWQISHFAIFYTSLRLVAERADEILTYCLEKSKRERQKKLEEWNTFCYYICYIDR